MLVGTTLLLAATISVCATIFIDALSNNITGYTYRQELSAIFLTCYIKISCGMPYILLPYALIIFCSVFSKDCVLIIMMLCCLCSLELLPMVIVFRNFDRFEVGNMMLMLFLVLYIINSILMCRQKKK